MISVDELEAANRVLDLRQEVALLSRIKQLRTENGIEYYRPHWKQHKFHLSGATGRYVRTGNRFGKSECGINEDLAWCLGGRIWYRHPFEIMGCRQKEDGTWEDYVFEMHTGGKDHPYIRQGIPHRPVKGLVIVVDWDKVEDVFTKKEGTDPQTWGKLWRFLPKGSIGKVIKGGRGNRVERVEVIRPAEFGGGSSTITFDTVEAYKHNNMGAESSDWDFIHIDEPIPEPMFKAHARGLMDRAGKYWFTCTPITEAWINDNFLPPKQNVLAETGTDGKQFTNDSGGSRFVVTGSIYDNPYKSIAGVAEFESTLTEDEKSCRLYGLPLSMAGLVYKEFVHDDHVLQTLPAGWKDWHLPPLDYTIRVFWDVHGVRRPQAILLGATAPDGTLFIYDEIYTYPLIRPNAELLLRKVDKRFVVDYQIDPRAMVCNPVSGTPEILDELAEHGLYFEPGSKDKTTGISVTKERLLERDSRNRPTIYFSPKLSQTLFELSRYVYDPKTNEPIDEHDHMLENLRRLIINGTDYVSPASEHSPYRGNVVIGFAEHSRKYSRVSNIALG